MTAISRELQQHWAALSPILSIRNEHEYESARIRLNELLDEVGDDEQHPLYDLLDTLGTLIRAYEVTHHPIPACSGPEVLAFLMEEHDLTPADLAEIGPPAMITDTLAGRHELDMRQIRSLAHRFHVSPAVFI